jgi:hypothetical protein
LRVQRPGTYPVRSEIASLLTNTAAAEPVLRVINPQDAVLRRCTAVSANSRELPVEVTNRFWQDQRATTMSWCSAKATFAICWQNIAPATTGHARTLRLTKILRSTDLRRQWAVSNQFRGSAAFILSEFGSHNRQAQG